MAIFFPMSFADSIDRYIAEKGLDTEHVFEVEGPEWGLNIIPLEVVVEAMKATSTREQHAIQEQLLLVELTGDDPMAYFGHLAKALAR